MTSHHWLLELDKCIEERNLCHSLIREKLGDCMDSFQFINATHSRVHCSDNIIESIDSHILGRSMVLAESKIDRNLNHRILQASQLELNETINVQLHIILGKKKLRRLLALTERYELCKSLKKINPHINCTKLELGNGAKDNGVNTEIEIVREKSWLSEETVVLEVPFENLDYLLETLTKSDAVLWVEERPQYTTLNKWATGVLQTGDYTKQVNLS